MVKNAQFDADRSPEERWNAVTTFVDGADERARPALRRAIALTEISEHFLAGRGGRGSEIPLISHRGLHDLVDSYVRTRPRPDLFDTGLALALFNSAFWISQRAEDRAGHALDAVGAIRRGDLPFADFFIMESSNKDRMYRRTANVGDPYFVDDINAILARGIINLQEAVSGSKAGQHAVLGAALMCANWMMQRLGNLELLGESHPSFLYLSAMLLAGAGQVASDISYRQEVTFGDPDDGDLPMRLNIDPTKGDLPHIASRMPIFIPSNNSWASSSNSMANGYELFKGSENLLLDDVISDLRGKRFATPEMLPFHFIATLGNYAEDKTVERHYGAIGVQTWESLKTGDRVEALRGMRDLDSYVRSTLGMDKRMGKVFFTLHGLMKSAFYLNASLLSDDARERFNLLTGSGAGIALRNALGDMRVYGMPRLFHDYAEYLRGVISYEIDRGGAPDDGDGGGGIERSRHSTLRIRRIPRNIASGSIAPTITTLPSLTR